MRIRKLIGMAGMSLALVVCLGNHKVFFAMDETLPGYVTYFVNDVMYIEIVGQHHVKPGDTGVVKSRGRDVAYVRVTEVGSRYLYLQIISQPAGTQINIGDSIVFEARLRALGHDNSPAAAKWRELDKLILGGNLGPNTTSQVSTPVLTPTAPQSTATLTVPSVPPVTAQEAPPPTGSSETANASTLKAGATEKNFAPLLVPLSVAASARMATSQDSNIFHGRLRSREVYQTVPSPASHSLESRLDNDGSIERLYGSPWAAVWSGNVSYLDGNTGQTSPDFEHPKLNIYNAMLTRKNDDGGSLKLGRFLPSELPGLGFLDGGQLDHVISPQWRLGGVLALRPDRITLSPTTKEPILSGYATTEQGTHGKDYYSGTFGMYQTLYRGVADERALLLDNRMDLGPKLNLFGTTQIDFNGGAEKAHKGPRITRLDFFGNSPVTPTVNVRAGLSHFERPDTQAERDLTQGTTQSFDNGFWRYFVGANQRLPFNFTLDEDLSTINSATAPTDQLWRVTISRFGFFFLPSGQISISAYNVTSAQGRGLGFQATASTPLWGDKLSMNLSSSSQYSTPSNSPKNYDVNDASARLNWRISKAWNADFGVTQSYAGGKATSTVGDSSIGYRW